MCSWDEKASVKIQKALEQEILTFIGDAQKVEVYMYSRHAWVMSTMCCFVVYVELHV